jgi:hypothetical protein
MGSRLEWWDKKYFFLNRIGSVPKTKKNLVSQNIKMVKLGGLKDGMRRGKFL